jgi:bifunctional ADP-heptose synthase (sugar kinase/adenylyltransferase)
MSRILVIGDLMVDRYRFFKPLRSDPANNAALVVECEKQVDVDGGAGNLSRNLESLCQKEINFFHARCFDEPGEYKIPTKIRYYVEDRFILREDKYDSIIHDKSIIEEFINFIKPNDFVIISDYHKGTLNYDDIVRIIEKCRQTSGVKVLVDTNHVYPEHEGIDWLKINLKTAKKCVENFSKDTAEKISQMNNSNVIITQGEEGFTAYLKDVKTNVVFTKDKNKNCIDAIGAGDTFLAGFVSYLVKHDDANLPALVYADIVAHLSTQQLGTIDVVDVNKADEEYKNGKTSIEECKDTLYVTRTIIND